MAVKSLATLRSDIIAAIATNTTGAITGNILQTQLVDLLDSLNAVDATGLDSWRYRGSSDGKKVAIDPTLTGAATQNGGGQGIGSIMSIGGGGINTGKGAYLKFDTSSTVVGQCARFGLNTQGGGASIDTWISSASKSRFRIQVRPNVIHQTYANCRLLIGYIGSNTSNGYGIELGVNGQWRAFHLAGGVFTYGSTHSLAAMSAGQVFSTEQVLDHSTGKLESFSVNGVAGVVPTTGHPGISGVGYGILGAFIMRETGSGAQVMRAEFENWSLEIEYP